MNTQNTELSKIKARIHALSLKTVDNGCSEHEALSAMAMVGQLLAQYNLTMGEIDVREQKCKTVYIPLHNRQRRHPVDSCISSLAKFADAKCWFSKSWDYNEETGKIEKKVSYAFFGQESDLEMVEYLFRVIFNAIESEAQEFKKTDEYRFAHPKKSAYVSFQRGMASRISARLSDLKRQRDNELAAAKSTGRALIVLKGQLVEDEFKKEGIKLRSYHVASRINNAGAFYAGAKAGDKVNLSRPINGGNSKVSGYLS